jgi:hypothetical protein
MPLTMADEPLHIDLDLHHGEVEGRAARTGGPEREFAGWVELLAALDQLIEPSGGEQ